MKKATITISLIFIFSGQLLAIEPLNRQLEADYDNITLKEALEELRDDSGLSMVIHKSLNLKQKVNIMVERTVAHKVLTWLKEQADIDYVIENGIVIFMSRDETRKKKIRKFIKSMITKHYHIADLMGDLKDFKGPEFDLLGGREGGGGISITESRSSTREPFNIVEFIDFIQKSIDPDSWNYGEINSINNSLVIRTSPENHQAIDKLIERLRSTQSRMVQVTAKVYQCDQANLDMIINSLDGLVLSDDGVKTLNQSQPIDILLGSGFSTQRFSMSNVKEKKYLRDFTAVVNVKTSILDPDIGYVSEGFSVDVRPTASSDAKDVLVDLKIGHMEIESLRKVNIERLHQLDESDNVIRSQNNIEIPHANNSVMRSTLRLPVNKWYLHVLGKHGDVFHVLVIKFNVIDY